MYLSKSLIKFGKLILRKIIKIIAARCQIVRFKRNKIDFGWSCAPDTAGELTALPQTPSWNKGDILLREGEGRKEGKGRRGTERQREGGRKSEGRKGKGVKRPRM